MALLHNGGKVTSMGVVFIGLMANHLLDALGIVFLMSAVAKACLRYPFTRWFW